MESRFKTLLNREPQNRASYLQNDNTNLFDSLVNPEAPNPYSNSMEPTISTPEMDEVPSPEVEQAPEVPKSYEDQLKDAMEQKRQQQMIGNLASGGETIGRAIAGVKEDPSVAEYYNNINKQAGDEVENISTLEKAKQMGEDRKQQVQFRDPNSAISKTMRQTLREFVPNIPDNLSAADLEKMYPAITASMNAKMNREAKLEAAKQRAHELSLSKQEKQTAKEFQVEQKRVDQFRDQIVKSKPFQGYLKMDANLTQLEQAAKDPSAFKDIGSIYSIMKSFDPESVVRESEFAVASNASSLYNSLKNQFAKYSSGERLQPQQRQELLKIVRGLREQAKKSVDSIITPYYNQAKKFKSFDQADLLPGNYDFGQPLEKEPAEPKAPSKQQFPGPLAPQSAEIKNLEMVDVVSPNGQHGKIPRKNLDKAIQQGYKVK